MIADASIQEVLNRVDIVEIVGQFIRLRKRGVNYIANCPFHNEKTPSFNASPSKGIYKCFGCGKGGNTVTFIQEHEKLTYPEAIRWLADYYKIALQETERSPEQVQQHQTEEALRIVNDFAANYFHDALLHSEEGQAIGLSYFKQRGFRKDIIDLFKLGYNAEGGEVFYNDAVKKGHNAVLLEKAGLIKQQRSGNGYYDAYRGRVIFPIHNMTGRVLGFGARILKSNEKAPKYVNTPENELYVKNKVLYGMYQSRKAIHKQDECFLVEGYTDVISLHQGGVENVVASSGTSLTEGQLRLIAQLTKNLTILYDGDAAGVKAALRGLDMALSQSFNVQLVLLPEGEDPDSFVQKMGEVRFHEYVKANKQDILSFRLEIGMRDVGDDPVRKSKLVQEIAESISHISKAEDFSIRNDYVRRAASKLNVEEAGLVNLINKYNRERIEQEQRQRRNEQAVPEPVAIPEEGQQPSTDLLQGIDEKHEWQLLRVLIAYGNKPFEGHLNVAMRIHSEVDPDLIENKEARKIYDLYFDHIHREQEAPDMKYFVNYPDPAVQRKVALLLQNNTDVSHNWSEMYGIVTLSDELNYPNEVDSTVNYFQLQNLKRIQMQVMDMLKQEKDPDKSMAILGELMNLKREEADLLRKQGTVVVKTRTK